jgi:glyoxylate carboligase
MRMTGAELMVKWLLEQGVDTVFGYPGGAILPFYDALRVSEIRHVLTAHEQGRSLMPLTLCARRRPRRCLRRNLVPWCNQFS